MPDPDLRLHQRPLHEHPDAAGKMLDRIAPLDRQTQSGMAGSAAAVASGGGLIDHAAAAAALERCAALLERLATDARVNQSGVLHVVIVDPLAPMRADFDAAVLIERSFGRPRTDWDADYADFARSKAELSWRHRRDTHALQALAPQRLRSGDSALWGSVWLDGIVVAVSGCEAAYDEAAAGAVAMMLRAHAKQALVRVDGTAIP
ncbi:MAG: hypothetical protein ACLGI7_01645 [Gammaproteobacteria bacterium]